MRYLITSKPGMTPWSYADTLDAATADARAARMQGLDGEVHDEQTGEMVDIDSAPDDEE